MINNTIVKFILATLCMTLGGVIYICYRAETLVMFTWFKDINISAVIRELRLQSPELKATYHNVIVYSVPNALWFLSGLILFDITWNDHKEKYIWLSIFSIIAIGSEIGQALNTIKGNFDWNDIYTMLLSLVIYSIFINKRICPTKC